MKRQRAQILVGILLCASIAFAHAEDMVRSLACPWSNDGAAPVVSFHDLTPTCCSLAKCHLEGSDASSPESDLLPETNQENGCTGRGCCNLFPSMIFLTTSAHFCFQLPNFPSVFEMTQSLPYSDFARSLYRPPQV